MKEKITMKISKRKRGRPDSAIITDSWRSRTEAATDRLRIRQLKWIEREPLTRAWGELVAVITRLTRPWPRLVADRLGPLSREAATLQAWADGTILPYVGPAGDHAKAYALVRELLADPAGWPRSEAEITTRAAERGITPYLLRREAIRRGITITGGLWHRPVEGPPAWLSEEVQATIHELDMIEARRRAPAPMFRPLFTALSDTVATSRAGQALDAALAIPTAPKRPAKLKTSAKARSQCLAAQSKLLRLKVGIERGKYLRRPAVEAAVRNSPTVFRSTWWKSWSQTIPKAGDHAAVLAVAESIRSRALKELESLGGLLKPKVSPPPRAKKRSRTPPSTRRTPKRSCEHGTDRVPHHDRSQ